MTRPGPDKRPTITIKGAQFTPEFRALLNMAAKKAGKTQAAWVAETLEAAARLVLARGTAPGPQTGTPPPPPAPDLQAQLLAMNNRTQDTARAVQDLTFQIEALQRQAAARPRRRWPRIRWD